MAITVLPPPFDPSSQIERLAEFPDNRLLIDLCGEYDRNLADLEKKLGVQILRRGNQLAVFGDPDATANAIEVLDALYERLESGRALEQGDIDMQIRMGHSAQDTGLLPGDQL